VLSTACVGAREAVTGGRYGFDQKSRPPPGHDERVKWITGQAVVGANLNEPHNPLFCRVSWPNA
jgi:hypothetical protein